MCEREEAGPRSSGQIDDLAAIAVYARRLAYVHHEHNAAQKTKVPLQRRFGWLIRVISHGVSARRNRACEAYSVRHEAMACRIQHARFTIPHRRGIRQSGG